MTGDKGVRKFLRGVRAGILLVLAGAVQAADPEQMLRELDEYPHARSVDAATTNVIDHEIGLGAIQKVRGAWHFKDSERVTGQLMSHTWRIVDGFSSLEVMDELIAAVRETEGAELLFSCDGRSCGRAVQWANRVFGQRVLYGREGDQAYRVFRLNWDQEYRLVVYAAVRSEDRQYLHVDLLRVEDKDRDLLEFER
jgi:hypothetical protein